MKSYPLINWERIGRAVAFYEGCGYRNVSVPWWVSGGAANATTPIGKGLFRVGSLFDAYLVGSAEQSFIEMLRRGEMNVNRYQATTPCFRDDGEDDLHQHYFMKTELFAPSSWDPHSVAVQAYTFLKTYLGDLRVVRTGESEYDLMCGGIELGSYGRRTVCVGPEDVTFTYGTGLAEPRTSVAVERGYL